MTKLRSQGCYGLKREVMPLRCRLQKLFKKETGMRPDIDAIGVAFQRSQQKVDKGVISFFTKAMFIIL